MPDKKFVLKVLKISAAVMISSIAALVLFFARDIIWFLNLQSGGKDFVAGNLSPAESKFKSATDVAQGFSTNDDRLAISLNALSTVLMAEGKYAEAEGMIKRSLKSTAKAHGEESCAMARGLAINAGFYRRQGKYDLAMPIYNRALSILEKCQDPQQLSEMLVDIAKLQLFLGHPDPAKSLYQRAYAEKIKTVPQDSVELVPIVNGFGYVAEWQGCYKSAENQHLKALAICKKVDRPFDMGGTLTCLANLKFTEGNLDEAMKLANQALDCFEKAKGLELLTAADSSSTSYIAMMRIETGDLKEGEIMLDRTASINAQRLGPKHPGTARDLCIRAKLQEKKGLKTEAIASQLKAIAIYEAAVGHDHRWVAQALGGLADLYADQGNNKKAEETYQQALALESKVMPAQHPDRAAILKGYAKLLAATGHAAEAKAINQEGSAIMSRAQQL